MTGSLGFQVSALWPHLVAMYCATLLPLAAGLPPIVAIIESVYAMTGREIWKQAARFWGKLFGVALLMWAIGSIALAILYWLDPGRLTKTVHGMSSTFLAVSLLPFALVLGLLLWNWFHDWWNPRRVRHLLVTWLWVPLFGILALLVSVVYGSLDNPVGIGFATSSVEIRIYDLPALMMNPVAQSRFVHLMSACYLTAATFVLSISAWYLLRDRNVRIARRSLTVSASFGLAAAISLAVLGDRSGYTASPGQQMQIAAIAAEWHTRAAPAPFTIFGFPDGEKRETRAAVDVPWALGLGATHSWRKTVAGIDELESANATRIRNGIAAFTMDAPAAGPAAGLGPVFGTGNDRDAGYALLLLRRIPQPAQASGEQVAAAARSTIPNVPLLFWTFRAMALLGVYSVFLFGCAFWLASKRRLQTRAFLRVAAYSLPLPWIAGALGWVLSEAGRGPWLIDGLLPVIGAHADRPGAIIGAIAFLAIAALIVVGAVLLVRLVHIGPDGLKFWPMDSGQAGKY